jgi:hypothetical protein
MSTVIGLTLGMFYAVGSLWTVVPALRVSLAYARLIWSKP